MSLIKGITGVLRRSAEGSLLKTSTATEGEESSRWIFRHIPGSRQFALFGEAANCSKVTVHCTLPISARRSSRRGRSLDRSRTKSQPSVNKQIIPFTCQLSNICRGFPLVLSLRCETRADQLVLHGAAFTRDSTELRQGPEAFENQLTYGGPHLTQTQLADVVLGLRPLSSPLEQTSHEEALFFTSTSCFDSSAHNWYGHNPVHTVRPEVTDAVAQLASCFGVDDALAAYVAEKARLVEQSEKAAWRQMFNDVILRR